MTLHAVIVAHSEAHRYLQSMLSALPTDSVHVYDDCSTDDTALLARKHGAVVTRRNTDKDPSFLDNEAAMRQVAWEAFERKLHPEEGDWVLALDCDEFLAGPPDVQLFDVLLAGLSNCLVSTTHVQIRVIEIFKTAPLESLSSNRDFFERIDGFWPTQMATRLVRYQKGMKFDCSQNFSTSVPGNVGQTVTDVLEGITLAHMGYATEVDRNNKHLYYSKVLHGHNPAHIASILQEPTLRKVELAMPSVWRGVR